MKSNQKNSPGEHQNHFSKKRNRFWLFFFGLVTLFFVSFAASSFILMNSYRLSFTDQDHAMMQQELQRLRSELQGKETEIEELKLKLSNYEGESSFVNELLNAGIETNQ